MRRLLVLLVASLALSCAAPSELARRSGVALEKGDADKAYQLARKALDKSPGNAEARAAMHEAATVIANDWKQRVRELAEVDTLGAARQAIEFTNFRAEAARYRAALEPDNDYLAQERALRDAAGAIEIQLGDRAMANGRPKQAYDHYTSASRFAPANPRLDPLLHDSYEAAVTRIAILPFENQTGSPTLTRAFTDHAIDEITRHMRSRDFRFTRIVPASDLANAATVAEWNRLTPDDALHIAARAGAQQVVWGRLYGLTSDTRTDTYRDIIWRKRVDKDENGNPHEHYVEIPFTAVSRMRDVSIGYDWELLEVQDGRRLAQYGNRVAIVAHTAYTSYVPDGAIGDYCLVPPGPATGDERTRYSRSETQWKAAMPEKVGLAPLLERSKSMKSRARYRRDYLPEFYPSASPWVFLDDLPPADDLAFAALVNEWQPIYDRIKRLEAVDVVDVDP